ncbi:MAG: hypoxanthine phosphoribosyltransferase [Chloroflexi bacterium]|nr:hypoxanthine phosphoribosyltransferase [Chloroflexota bacterium]
MTQDICEVILTSQEIQSRVQELGALLSHDYAGKDPVLVGVLKGVLVFMADLVRAISIPVSVDFMAVSSYGQTSGRQGVVRITKDLDESITGRHVILVEDIVDTGLTLGYVVKNLQARDPASLSVCALFDKKVRRLVDVDIAYRGFEIPDRFVVGYGLDYGERYRNLPFVGIMTPEAYER